MHISPSKTNKLSFYKDPLTLELEDILTTNKNNKIEMKKKKHLVSTGLSAVPFLIQYIVTLSIFKHKY